MRRNKKNTLLIMICVSTVFLFLGCTKQSKGKPEIPDSVRKVAETDNTKGINDVNLYYDNTQSMYGFVQSNPNNQTPKNFVIATDALYDIVTAYQESNFLKLGITEGNPYLKWLKIPDDKGFQTGYKTKDFYTYTAGVFEGSTGPLQLLFSDNTDINFDAINIFITDMAEQNLQNSDLARMLNKVTAERPGYSVCMYAINSYFFGTASIPVAGVVDASGNLVFNDIPYDGMRPYYCIMVGPTEELANLASNYTEYLESKGLKENSEFFYTNFLSINGVEKIKNEEIVKTKMIDFFKGDSKDIIPKETNETANFAEISTQEMFEGVNQEYSCLSYCVDNTKQNPDNRKEGVINLFLPINKIEGMNIEGIEYSIDKDNIKLCYAEESKDKKEENKGKEENKSEEEVKEKTSNWIWKEMPSFESKQIFEIKISKLNPGDEIFNSKAENPKNPKVKIHTVENENGELGLTLECKTLEKLPSNYITLNIPIVADEKSKKEIPAWLNQEAFAIKTENLIEFYKGLSGDFASVVEKENFDKQRKATIGNVIINIKTN